VDRHRLVGEELQNRQLVDDAAGDRLDVLDVDPFARATSACTMSLERSVAS